VKPTFDDVFAVMSAASVGDTAARVPIPDDANLEDAETRLGVALNVLLDDLAFRTAELRRTEEQLRQSQKMEAIGRLAGGIAHDFNNMLSVIMSYASIVSGELKAEDPLRADVEEITLASRRAADLTRQLLAFSRQQVIEPRIVDLNDIINKMDNMIRRLIGEDIRFRTKATPGLGKVKVDPGQMDQVIMNLVVNARDAMPTGGQLTIETGNVDLGEQYAREHLGVTPGPHVMLAVSDTGTGMDKATQDRIFEPFFTTKEQGKGTGLGLATAFGIVQQNGGNIWVYSELGKGATFKIYFPQTAESELPVAAPAQPPAIVRGTETILLVEDDEQLRVVVREVLEKNGYRVIEAPQGDDALLFAKEHEETIHMVLTDVVMPLMSGKELARILTRLHPEMKVLYMSGYTQNAVVHHGVLDAGANLLQKPITPELLLRRVREVLDAST